MHVIRDAGVPGCPVFRVARLKRRLTPPIAVPGKARLPLKGALRNAAGSGPAGGREPTACGGQRRRAPHLPA